MWVCFRPKTKPLYGMVEFQPLVSRPQVHKVLGEVDVFLVDRSCGPDMENQDPIPISSHHSHPLHVPSHQLMKLAKGYGYPQSATRQKTTHSEANQKMLIKPRNEIASYSPGIGHQHPSTLTISNNIHTQTVLSMQTCC